MGRTETRTTSERDIKTKERNKAYYQKNKEEHAHRNREYIRARKAEAEATIPIPKVGLLKRVDRTQFVHRTDAARELGIPVNQISKLVKAGVLIPRRRVGRDWYFDKDELVLTDRIMALNEVGSKEAYLVAKQAFSVAHNVEKRIDELHDLLGLNFTPLKRDEESIHQTLEAIALLPTTKQLHDVRWVRYWGGAFFSIDETYLELISHYIGSNEPWKPVYDFSSAVLRDRPVEEEKVSLPLRAAYAYFQSGRSHLLHVSYLLCAARRGSQVANKLFPPANRKAIDQVLDCLPK